MAMITWLIATAQVSFGVRPEILASAAPADSSIAIRSSDSLVFGIKPVNVDWRLSVAGLSCPANVDWVDLASEAQYCTQLAISDDENIVL